MTGKKRLKAAEVRLQKAKEALHAARLELEAARDVAKQEAQAESIALQKERFASLDEFSSEWMKPLPIEHKELLLQLDSRERFAFCAQMVGWTLREIADRMPRLKNGRGQVHDRPITTVGVGQILARARLRLAGLTP